jgi:hypothetical protein
VRRSLILVKFLAAGLLVAGILGPARTAQAYKACSSSQTAYCSQFGGPIVICSTAHYCFSNLCFAQCAGFSSANCYEAVTCSDPPPLN